MAQAIREVVSNAILFEMADPRVRSVTVLSVEVSSDMRNATVRVSIMGTDAEQRLALRGLKHAAGFIQSRVAARLQTRFTPILSFKLDESVKKSVEISRLIDQAVAADRRPGEHSEEHDDEDLEEHDLADIEEVDVDEDKATPGDSGGSAGRG
jgi:ribosome-binding factor A